MVAQIEARGNEAAGLSLGLDLVAAGFLIRCAAVSMHPRQMVCQCSPPWRGAWFSPIRFLCPRASTPIHAWFSPIRFLCPRASTPIHAGYSLVAMVVWIPAVLLVAMPLMHLYLDTLILRATDYKANIIHARNWGAALLLGDLLAIASTPDVVLSVLSA